MRAMTWNPQRSALVSASWRRRRIERALCRKGENDVGAPAGKDAEKRRRQDSELSRLAPIDGDAPPDNVRRFRKRPPPEMVADHTDGRRTRLVVGVAERTTEDRVDPEPAKVIPRHELTIDELGGPVVDDVQLLRFIETEDIGKSRGVIA